MDLVGKMRTSVQMCINTPQAQGAGFLDNYGVLLTTRGYYRKQSGNRGLSFGEIEGQSSYILTTRYQQAIEANLAITTKFVIDNVWHTVDSWEKKEETNHIYEFRLNKKEPVTSNILVLPQVGSVGLQPPLYLATTPGATTVDIGVTPSEIVLVARSGVVQTKVEGVPAVDIEYSISGSVLTFAVPFNAGEIIYVLYKTSA